jgi:hypothetical protein
VSPGGALLLVKIESRDRLIELLGRRLFRRQIIVALGGRASWATSSARAHARRGQIRIQFPILGRIGHSFLDDRRDLVAESFGICRFKYLTVVLQNSFQGDLQAPEALSLVRLSL